MSAANDQCLSESIEADGFVKKIIKLDVPPLRTVFEDVIGYAERNQMVFQLFHNLPRGESRA